MIIEKKDVRINVNLLTFKAGQVIKLKFRKGVPVDRFWRRRLQDAKIDNCIEVVEDTKPGKEVEGEEE